MEKQCVIKQGKAYVLHKLSGNYTFCCLHIFEHKRFDREDIIGISEYSSTGLAKIEDHNFAPVELFIQRKFMPAQYDFACPVCFPYGVSNKDIGYEL